MKKILTYFLVVNMLLILSACNSKNTMCDNCGAKLQENMKFCYQCGVELTFQDNNEILQKNDYSDFGFENNYGMTEWIRISTYDFNCTSYEDAYIQTRYPHMFIFTNGYIQRRSFNETYIYKEGNYNEGKLLDTSKYAILDNYTLQLDTKIAYWDETIEIKNVDIINGIPIINISDGRSYGDTYMFVPAYFIDTTKEPEYPYGEFNGTQLYFLKSEYLIKEEP